MESTDSNGWVKLHRNIIESKLWSCSDATLRIGLYLVMAANHAPRYVRRIAVDRGQCVRSLTRISEDCHVTRKTARYAIKTLVGDGFISVDAPFGAQQGHRITVCKYNDFQSVEDKQGHTRGTRGAQEVTHEVTHEVSTNKKERIEECKNERIICDGVQQNPNTCSTLVERVTEKQGIGFVAFWNAYPKKVGKKAAFLAWGRAKDKPALDAILKAVEAQKQSADWRKDGGQFIPNPATWLNQGRWDDEAAPRHIRRECI
jgi:hypothetical protein